MTIDEIIEFLDELGGSCLNSDEYIACNTAIKAIKEVQKYRAIGTLDELITAIKYVRLAKAHRTVGRAIEECAKYEEIGTLEECRAAVEKQTAKLVIDNTPTEDSVWYQCPTCKGDLTIIRGFYCQYCGQKLHWR